ncbi:MAG: ABC transporter permease subunit [Deltaproteobacteria bacterium]|nr:ABC transporter permease subunit [Deltaproteobacteria bacterium]
MRQALVIAKREFSAYFKSPIAYIVVGLFLVFAGFLFFDGFFLRGQATMDAFFGWMPVLFLFFGPGIAMRLLAEERGTGTIEMLLTMPVRDWEVVVGKYLAALGLLTIGIVLTLPFALTVAKLGPLDWGPVIGGYAGSILLGGTYLAIGLLASAFTKNQLVALIIGAVTCLAAFLLGNFVSVAGSTIGPIIEYASPQYHFEKIARGVIELRNVIYYTTTIAVLLLLSVQVLAARKWR